MNKSPNAILRGVVVFLALFTLLSYGFRYRVEAALWHWKHDGILEIGIYKVTVPGGWLVEPEGAEAATIIRLTSPSVRQTTISPTIGLSSFAGGRARDPALWKSLVLKRYPENYRVEKNLQFSNETVSCLGQTVDKGSVVNLECLSSGQLSIVFLGNESDLNDFYSFVSRIHK